MNLGERDDDSDRLSHSVDFIQLVSNAILNYILLDTYKASTEIFACYHFCRLC
jgi:hypothetical protein